ncbi:MAG: adenylate kinase [Candidatus Hadarchaeum yellowstonense]|jgi:adenylate kinase|uniref:Adenylate kinase n=1 Tax=Hadarchaeum yellowstonense TaxID=1776334 RepID=A0A147K0S6_HADYE|nr:MAG: adenylate kinase [Candidatus Hadarchaeum yellowstonense]
MNLIILGAPGSGKGTQTTRLKAKLNIPAISTGDIFRKEIKEETELGKRIKKYLDSGQLVPDEIVIDVIKERIKQPDCKNGFILDGFPRTLEQAKALDKIVKIDACINLSVPKEIIVKRLSARRTCKNCGEIYNLLVLKPKVDGVCDKCGGPLFQRDDDRESVIEERFRVYERQTEPLLKYYESRVPVITVTCNSVDAPPELITEQIINGLKRLKLID